MQDQITINKNELSNLSVRDLFYKYVRFLPLILLSVALALLVAFAYLRYATRIYSATGVIQIKNEQANRGNDKVEELLSGGNKTQNIQSEIEVLKSKPLMQRVVQNLGLQTSYSASGTIIKSLNVYKQGPFLLEIFEIADSSSTFSFNVKFINESSFTINNEKDAFSFGQFFKNKFGVFRLVKNYGNPTSAEEFKIAWQPANVVAANLVGGIGVFPKTPGTGILAISYQATNGYMAADIINQMMLQYDSMTIEQSNYSTDLMLDFIEGRLDKLKGELDSLQVIELGLRQKYNLYNEESQTNEFSENIRDADKSFAQEELKISAIDFITNYVNNKKNQYERVVTSFQLNDLTLVTLVAAYNDAQLEREKLINANIPLDNPSVKEAEALIEKQRLNLLENLRNIKLSSADVIASIRKKSGINFSELKSMPYKLKEVLDIRRQISTKLELFSLLEKKREEAAITRSSTVSNSKIMDRAMPSNTPIKPNRQAIQLIAILVGLGIPALGIFMAEVLNDKVSTRYDIEKLTTAPIIGEVGHSYADNTLLVNKTSRSMVAEQFRIIRSNLQYVLNKVEKPVILVTSSYSGEGKSFVSTNMGGVLALTGKKTIILEFDIRKPKVLSGLKMSRRTGISNFLVGKAELNDLIIPVPDHENLYVLPCGPIPPNPSELLLDQKVTELFDKLKAEFDVIIIDTAPIGMVSDSMTLGKFANCTLYLTRQGHTFKKQVALIDELYKENKLPKISIVINDVKVKPGYGYYGYGRYGYGYGYGEKSSYYEEDITPPTPFERLMKRVKKFFKKK
jgi:tyrosine-protein kinase Etk/Wzc